MVREVRGFYSVIYLRNRWSRMDDFRANLVDESTATSDGPYRVYLRLNLDEFVEGSCDFERDPICFKDRLHLCQWQGWMFARQNKKDSCSQKASRQGKESPRQNIDAIYCRTNGYDLDQSIDPERDASQKIPGSRRDDFGKAGESLRYPSDNG